MNFDSREFRNAMGNFATGVTVVSVREGKEAHGMTANAVSSVSLTPPLVLICVDHRANSLQLIRQEGYFGINILTNKQKDISRKFANQKLDGEPEVSFSFPEVGAPLLNNALVNLNCKVVNAVEAGDHTVFFGEVMDLKVSEGEPLCFFKGQYRELA